jgi:site-specific recombinase XerD
MNEKKLPVEAENFLSSLIGKSPNTRRLYRYVVTRFNDYIKGKEIRRLTVNDVMSYLSALEKEGASKNTLMVHVLVLKLSLKNMGRGDIAEQIKSIRKTPTLPTVLPEENVYQMIVAAEKLRDKLIVRLPYRTGIRVSELLAKGIQQDHKLPAFPVRVFGLPGRSSEPVIRLGSVFWADMLTQSYLPIQERFPDLWLVRQDQTQEDLLFRSFGKYSPH